MGEKIESLADFKKIKYTNICPNKEAIKGIENIFKFEGIEKILFEESQSAIKAHTMLNRDFYGKTDFEKYLKKYDFEPENLNFMNDEYYYSFTQGNMEFYFYPKL